MPSKNRVKPTRGRTIPGGVGPTGLRTWGPDGLRRVGSWIQRLRIEHGSARLAEGAGIPVNKVNKICDGRQEPTVETAEKIAAWLGVDLDAIVRGPVVKDLGYMQGKGAA